MTNISYYALVVVCISLWAFIALNGLDRAYGRIDIINQEQGY